MSTSNQQQVQPSGDRALLNFAAEFSYKNKTTKQFYKTLFGDSSHQGEVFEITVTEKNKQQKQEYCIYIHEVSSTFYDAAVVFLTGEDKGKDIYKSFAAFRYTEIILKFIRTPTIEEQNSLLSILSGTQQREDDDSGASAGSKDQNKKNNTSNLKIPKQKSHVPPISEINAMKKLKKYIHQINLKNQKENKENKENNNNRIL
jgi:hypothetical protein